MNSKPKTYWEAVKRVRAGELFEDYETLSLADDCGFSLAHYQTCFNWVTEDKKVLALADRDGTRVAHLQVLDGWRTNDPDILALADNDGWTVADAIRELEAK